MKKMLTLVVCLSILNSVSIVALSKSSFMLNSQNVTIYKYDMVIISPSLYTDELQTLIDHKNNRNLITTIKTTEEIFSEYSGRDEAEKIKYFIKDALDTLDISYVLLVGGADQLPSRYTHIYFEYDYQTEWVFLSDLYYADIYDKEMNFSSWDTNENNIFAEYNWSGNYDELDLYPDVYLGRLACINENEVIICVNKIINYETEKAYSRYWFKNLVLMGGDSLLGDEHHVDEGEYVNKAVINILDGFIPERIWASNGKLYQANNINNAINKGAGFVFFNGHGLTDIWATHPHESSQWIPIGNYKNSHVKSLVNGNKLPIVISDACYHCQYDVASDCFGWTFVTNPDGGCIAFLGGTDIDVSYGGEDIITKGIEKLCIDMSTNYIAGDKTFGELWGNGIKRYLNDNMDEMDYITIEEFQPFGDPSLIIAGESQPPSNPEIDGPINGNIGVEYEWTFVSTDPDGDNISYYIDWGDKSGEGGWYGPYFSGEEVVITHKYKSKDTYTIKAIAVDEYGIESNWTYFEVTMPRIKIANISIFNFILDHPNILSLIHWLLEKLEYNI
ncbi:hypothetical protein AYK20_02955 [Thermoplasmatales archaeon SG8-52-1]|nr:MAG: hypothetical protein AYK20_02955 [Thermoplasmatales archaeon SG8-52-1]